jgi:hypothetical protein
MHFSSSESVSAMENIVIPHYILGGKRSREQLLHVLHAVATTSDEFRQCLDTSRLCRPIYDFLRLSKEVEELCAIPPEDLDMRQDDIEGMIDTAANLKITLSKYLDYCEEQAPLVKVPFEVTLTPRSVYLTEVCNMLTHLRLQLLSLKNGTIVESKECSSELVFALNADGLFGTGEAFSDAGSILRGMCGYNTAVV